MLRRLFGTSLIRRWWPNRWKPYIPADVGNAYAITFSQGTGAVVLQHLMDTVYCTVYEGTDPQEALVHNSQRLVVHRILENIDAGINPHRHVIEVDTNGMARTNPGN